MIDRPLVKGRNSGTIIVPVGSASGIVAQAWISVRCDAGGTASFWFQKSADTAGSAPGAGPAWTAPDGSPFVFRNAARPWREVPSGTEYVQYVVDAAGPGAICIELLAK